MTFCAVGCLHKRGVAVRSTYNATLCYLASGSFYTGINGTVVVVGVKRLFVWGGVIGTALCYRNGALAE
jgi:hypothetical protein